MRAPTDDVPLFDASAIYGEYSDADWRQIETSLAGIDLDAATVKDPFTEWDKVPLREALQRIASYFAAFSRLKPATRSERIEQLRQDEAALEAACRTGLHP
jgi:hypothetical protein